MKYTADSKDVKKYIASPLEAICSNQIPKHMQMFVRCRYAVVALRSQIEWCQDVQPYAPWCGHGHGQRLLSVETRSMPMRKKPEKNKIKKNTHTQTHNNTRDETPTD